MWVLMKCMCGGYKFKVLLDYVTWLIVRQFELRTNYVLI